MPSKEKGEDRRDMSSVQAVLPKAAEAQEAKLVVAERDAILNPSQEVKALPKMLYAILVSPATKMILNVPIVAKMEVDVPMIKPKQRFHALKRMLQAVL
ncbi:unnamed protein product [Cylindrotheca closterium]|uniref:Uncharacterized protein n=1 Tax=Cylindrotheca closterium TaxID=2856 RepID=A0AAD2FNY2_9STRA|nr:unnamed protein product [Cylindrotheca closterium]